MLRASCSLGRFTFSCLLLGLLLWSAGCGKSTPRQPDGKSPGGGQTGQNETDEGGGKGTARQPALDAQGVLKKMVAAYRAAPTYQDLGFVRLSAKVGDKEIDDQRDFAVVMVRPNKLQMKVYAAKVVLDGKQFRATVDYLPGQVLTKPCPEKLAAWHPYADCLLNQALSGWVVGRPIQTMLLLNDDPMKAILADADEVALSEPGTIEDHDCYRVRIGRPEGTMVLWIDRQTFVLRRIVPPTDALWRQFSREGTVERLKLVVEFAGAKLGAPIDPALFAFDLPAGAEAVPYFLPPAAKLLGKKAPDFKFFDLEGKAVTPASLAGKVAVLDFWAVECQPARDSMPGLERIYQKYKDNTKVAVLAVALDPPEVETAKVREAAEQMKLHAPLARDPSQSSAALRVMAPPVSVMVLVLGPDGVLQHYEDRNDPVLMNELPGKIARLLAGESLYKEWLDRFDREEKQFEKDIEAQAKLEAAGGAAQATVSRTPIAPRSEPKKLKRTRLWQCNELKKPGNILVLPAAGGGTRLLVVDSWNSVAELGPDGKLIANHKLDIDDKEAVCNLRPATLPGGKRLLAGFAVGQQRLHLFDENWKAILHFPADALKYPHAGIADVELADLEGNGDMRLYVSYWGLVGVQAVSLEGQRMAINHTATCVARMAVAPAEKGQKVLLCASIASTPIVLDAALKQRGLLPVGGRAIHALAGADLAGDGKLAWCGLAGTKPGDNTAVGFDLAGNELWTYALPEGAYWQPLEPIVPGKLLPGAAGQWLLPGPDGSIHILAAAGKPLDRFNYGAELCGLAIAEIAGKPALIVATAGSVEAWRVE